MDSKKKVTISWSGGKDSTLALYKAIRSGEYEIVSLHTVLDADNGRVGLHGVREELIDAQANALGFPLVKLYLESADDHQNYRNLMLNYYRRCVEEGIEGVVFGDIFLEDLKRFREELLLRDGLLPVFPLWKEDSAKVMEEFLDAQFKTVVCAADANLFQPEQLGKVVDREFLNSLSAGVDVCGENGEFHTFVFDGPLFKKPVAWTPGELVKRSYQYRRTTEHNTVENLERSFWFQEVLLQSAW